MGCEILASFLPIWQRHSGLLSGSLGCTLWTLLQLEPRLHTSKMHDGTWTLILFMQDFISRLLHGATIQWLREMRLQSVLYVANIITLLVPLSPACVEVAQVKPLAHSPLSTILVSTFQESSLIDVLDSLRLSLFLCPSDAFPISLMIPSSLAKTCFARKPPCLRHSLPLFNVAVLLSISRMIPHIWHCLVLAPHTQLRKDCSPYPTLLLTASSASP